MRVSTHTPRPGSRTEDRTRRTNKWGTGNRGVESHALPQLTPLLKHPFAASEERGRTTTNLTSALAKST